MRFCGGGFEGRTPEGFALFFDSVEVESDGGNLDDLIAFEVEAGGFSVEGNVARRNSSSV